MFAKKNVVALAAMLVAATAAQAQVKLYGYVEANVGSYQGFSFDGAGNLSKDKSTVKVESGNMMTSFIGIAGSEQLTPGLKAEFALESFIAADTGASIENIAGFVNNNSQGFFGRTSWVGLSGDFGKVALGQYDNAFFIMGLSYNPFGSSMVFSPAMVSYYSFAGFNGPFNGVGLGYDTGWVNSITYESPVIAGGFSGTLQYAPKEERGGDRDSKDNYSVSAAYNNGPISAMVVYTNTGANPGGNPAFFVRQKNFGLGGSYDFGVVKAFGQYSQIKSYDNGVDNGKQNYFQVGASVPVTASGSVMLSYGETDFEDADGNDNGKLKQYSLGYDHAISKRTSLFGAYTNQDVTDLGSASTFAVGVKHNF